MSDNKCGASPGASRIHDPKMRNAASGCHQRPNTQTLRKGPRMQKVLVLRAAAVFVASEFRFYFPGFGT